MALLSFDEISAQLFVGPDLHLQTLDFVREAGLFLRLNRSAFAAASFLDDRILSNDLDGRWASFAEIDSLAADPRPRQTRPVHFIFHAGHVGSTLLSRLIEEAGGVVALREPLTLRVLADAFDGVGAAESLSSPARLDRLLALAVSLWRRGYPDTRATLVKASSSVGRIAPRLLAEAPDARALYLNVGAETYLTTLLAGQNSHLDLRGHAVERARRLARWDAPIPEPLHAMSLGEIAALAWAAERMAQLRAEEAAPGRVLPLDFDAFLADPAAGLASAFAHLRLDAPDSFFAAAPQSPWLTRYAKAPEHAYSPALRAEIMRESRAINADEIAKGLRWLDRWRRGAENPTARSA